MPLFGLFKDSPANGTVEHKEKMRKKRLNKDSARYTLKQSLKKSLGNGALMKEAVKLPNGEDHDEWIAMNTTEIYNTTNLCFGFVSDFCTPKSCPQMTAGAKFTYLWQDKDKYTKPTSMAACEYVDLLMSWAKKILDNDTIFVNSGKFPKTFLHAVTKIWKRLARVYFHIYYHHWDGVETLKAEPHVNTCFKHYYYFAKEFGLVNDDDLAPLTDISKRIDL